MMQPAAAVPSMILRLPAEAGALLLSAVLVQGLRSRCPVDVCGSGMNRSVYIVRSRCPDDTCGSGMNRSVYAARSGGTFSD